VACVFINYDGEPPNYFIHIGLANLKGDLTHKVRESVEFVNIEDVAIDNAGYFLDANRLAFGIRVLESSADEDRRGYFKWLNLYLPVQDKLTKVLDKFLVYSLAGDDTSLCSGTEHILNKTLIISKEKTNSFFDIKVTIIETLNHMKGSNQPITSGCIMDVEKIVSFDRLKFDGKSYHSKNSK